MVVVVEEGGHTASIGLGDRSSSCASLLTAHGAMQTPAPWLLLHYNISNHAALSHLQISAHCTRLHKRHLTKTSKIISHCINHKHRTTLMSTKPQHMLQLSQMVCPAMACIFPEILRYTFCNAFQNNWHCLQHHSSQHVRTFPLQN